MEIDRQVIQLVVESTDDVNECTTTVIGWCVICAKSAEVVDLYVDYAKPEKECIDCLKNLGF